MERAQRAAKAHGWTGGVGVAKADEFAKWAEEKGLVFEDDGSPIDLKSLVVEQPDAATVVITEVEDEDPVDDENEMEDEDDEEKRSAAELRNEVKTLRKQVKKYEASHEVIQSQIADLSKRAGRPAVKVKSGEELRYEDRAKKGRTAFRNYDAAKGFGHILKSVGHRTVGDIEAATAERKALAEHLDRSGIDSKAYATTPIASGGALVPEEYMADVINNVEDFGVTRQLVRVISMNSSRLVRPVKTGLLPVYYPDEGGAITEAQNTWSNVTLAPKMGAVLTRASRQILDDSAISLIDDAAQEMARAIAYVEDNTLFYGDGTTGTDNEYIPNVTGIIDQFGSTATDDSRSSTGGGTALAHTGAQLAAWIGKVPQYARQNAVIVTSAELHSAIFDRLAINDIGGMTQSDYEAGMIGRYRGIPILPSQVFPNTTDAGDGRVDALVGDFSRAAMLGDRMSLEIATSEDRYFDSAQIAIRALVRHDINVHDLGATDAKSPVVALYQN